MKAYKLRDLEGFTGIASLYNVSPPIDKDIHYIVVSATIVPFSGPECFIFPADASGKIINWQELDGSYQGGLDHSLALKNIGYEIVEGNLIEGNLVEEIKHKLLEHKDI